MSYRTSLFVDRATITVNVDTRHQANVDMCLEGLAGRGDLKQLHRSSTFNYTKAYANADQGTQAIDIFIEVKPRGTWRSTSANPVKGTHRRYLRVDWNPSRLSSTSANALKEILEATGEERCEMGLPLRAVLTRIDLSFDVYGALADSFIVFSRPTRRTVSTQYEYGGEGKVHAIYLGAKDSDRRLLIYDKARQLQERWKSENGIVGLPILRGVLRRWRPRVRFELRLKNASTVHGLLAQPNPFLAYSVTSSTALRSTPWTAELQHFLDSCQFRGAQAALSLIEDRRKRSRYAQFLSEPRAPEWWNPEQIWSEAPTALHAGFEVLT